MRKTELKSMRKAFCVSAILFWSLYFFPEIIKPVVFTTFISLGNKIDVKMTFTIMVVFNLI